MNEPFDQTPEPKKVGVWAEGTRIEAKQIILPIKKTTDSSSDIPTLPDLDDFQDILEKDLSKAPISDHKDTETVNTLAEVGGGFSNSIEGMDAVLEVLRSYVPKVEVDSSDSVWTIDSLLTQLADEEQLTGS